jgi:hypothetical protein
MVTVAGPALTDPAEEPTEAVVHRHLGEAGRLWDALFRRVHEAHPELEKEWRYYRDGKSWLLKVTHGSRTICWVSVGEHSFRLTVYLPARAEHTIAGSSLPTDLKDQFFSAADGARTRGITVVFHGDPDIEAADQLLTLRDRFR